MHAHFWFVCARPRPRPRPFVQWAFSSICGQMGGIRRFGGGWTFGRPAAVEIFRSITAYYFKVQVVGKHSRLFICLWLRSILSGKLRQVLSRQWETLQIRVELWNPTLYCVGRVGPFRQNWIFTISKLFKIEFLVMWTWPRYFERQDFHQCNRNCTDFNFVHHLIKISSPGSHHRVNLVQNIKILELRVLQIAFWILWIFKPWNTC